MADHQAFFNLQMVKDLQYSFGLEFHSIVLWICSRSAMAGQYHADYPVLFGKPGCKLVPYAQVFSESMKKNMASPSPRSVKCIFFCLKDV